jgi:large subunit ribosomal protein L6
MRPFTIHRFEKRCVIPPTITLSLENSILMMQGPLGKVELHLKTYDTLGDYSVKLVQKGRNQQELHLRTQSEDGQKALQTLASLVSQYIEGLTKGFFVSVELVGIGFKANFGADRVELRVGYSHPVELIVPNDVKVFVPKPTLVCLFGVSKKRVSQVAATLKALKPVEPYKGKGIQLKDEITARKVGKKK